MKIVCLNAKKIFSLVSLGVIAVLLAIMSSVTATSTVYLGYAARLVPIYSVKTEEKKVALTFDAAWGSDKTLKIVETLKNENILGTFFLTGFWSEANADKIKAIDEAGFDIGTHSQTHPKMSTLSASQVASELTSSMKLITDVTGKTVRFFRPPFGDYNDQLITTATGLGLQTIQWDVDSLDWKGLSGQQILARIKSGVKSGSIILFHNNSDYILEALPLVISYLKAEGYSMVKLSELVYKDNYSVNNNGEQIANKA